MSIEALNWAFKQPVPQSSAKFVLIALANRADADKQGRIVAFPSVEYLANVTSQNRKTVISNLAKLREWGLIEDTGNRVGSTAQVIVYAIQCPPDLFAEQSQKRNGSKTGTVPKSAGKSPVFGREQSQKRDTDSPITQQGLLTDSAQELPAWLPPEAWALWEKFRGRKRATWTEDAQALSLRTLTELWAQGYSPLAVIEQSIERGWTGLFPIRQGGSHAGHRESVAERTRRLAIEGERRDAAERSAQQHRRADPVGADG